MPLLVLIAIASLAGLLAAVATLRYPSAAHGTAPVGAVEEVMERAAAGDGRLRRWFRARSDPATATGLVLSVALGCVVAGGVLIGVLAYLVRGNDAVLDADSSVAAWGERHSGAFSRRAIEGVTQLGETRTVVVLAIVLVIVEAWRAPSRFLIPFLAVVMIGDSLVTTAVKDLADRARPTLEPVAQTLGPSFPSGHSSTAAAFFAAAALILGRRRGRSARAALAGAAVAIAVAVAASRVLLDVHWLTDVIAGLALGWAWFALCAIAFGGRLLRFGATAERAAEGARRRRRPGRRGPAPPKAAGRRPKHEV
jgi:membrane-associated phospholipid phosphatase